MLRSFLLQAFTFAGMVALSAASSCSYPDQWAAEGLSFQPVRYFTTLPTCDKATIYVHYPSKTQQVRSFSKTENGSQIETGLWVFRNGLEGSSVNIPLFGRDKLKYSDYEQRQGLCDVMTFRTGDDKPMAGAIEMHQHLTDLKAIKDKAGNILYYEKNFTSHQSLEVNLKQHQDVEFEQWRASASNYLYSAFTHRVKIDKNGKCIPLLFQRVIYFGTSCHYVGIIGLLRPREVPQLIEFYFVVNPKSYMPNAIGKFDRLIPQLSCSNDFLRLNDADTKVQKAIKDGQCVESKVLDRFIEDCCKLSFQDYLKAPGCDLTHLKIWRTWNNLKQYIWQEVCERRTKYESGEIRRVFHRDESCQTNF